MMKHTLFLFALLSTASAFTVQQHRTFAVSRTLHGVAAPSPLFMATESKEEGIIELTDEDESKPEETQQVAPFLSQGEVDPDAMNPDLANAKEARVILYMVISLLPVLFLIPLMLGSRDLIPADWLPPVELNQ